MKIATAAENPHAVIDDDGTVMCKWCGRQLTDRHPLCHNACDEVEWVTVRLSEPMPYTYICRPPVAVGDKVHAPIGDATVTAVDVVTLHDGPFPEVTVDRGCRCTR